MVFPQVLLLSLCVLVPALTLYVWKRPAVAVAWVGLITVLDIFNSQAFMNISAVLLFGAAALPYLWIHRRSLLGHPELRWMSGFFVLLAILGVYYGHLDPWPDLTHERGIKDQAGMRSILHFGRTVLEWATALFLLIELEKNPKKTTSIYLKSLFFGSLVLAASALAESWLKVDFYHFFTGGRELLLPGRPRGFAYEPRGLSQNLAYALLILPFLPMGRWKYAAFPVFLFVGFGWTFSYSGILVLISGITLLVLTRIFFGGRQITGSLRTWALGVTGALFLLALAIRTMPPNSKDYIATRFQYLFEHEFAEKFEVFDAASINFLMHQPKHLAVGTGPGLIYLPASEYILERDKIIWGNRFDALPHLGIVLVISNAGIIGLLLLLTPFALALIRKRPEPDPLLFLGIVMFGLFFIQIRYYFLFGIAALLCRAAWNRPPERVDS
jgi:hypothetical protein